MWITTSLFLCNRWLATLTQHVSSKSRNLTATPPLRTTWLFLVLWLYRTTSPSGNTIWLPSRRHWLYRLVLRYSTQARISVMLLTLIVESTFLRSIPDKPSHSLWPLTLPTWPQRLKWRWATSLVRQMIVRPSLSVLWASTFSLTPSSAQLTS